VLEVSSISLGMQGDTGQEAVLAGYAGYLNSLTFPVQTLVRVLPVDIDGYLTRLDRRARHDLPAALADVAQDTAAYPRRKARQRTLLDRQFYVVVPAHAPAVHRRWWPFGRANADRPRHEAADTAAKQLSFRCEEIGRQLARCGLTARRLSDAELLDLFHACFCPDSVGLERARLGLANKNPFALVKPPRRIKEEMRVLDVSQARYFLTACAEENSGVSNMLAMALWTGWRAESELGGLRWADVDEERGTMRLAQVWLCQPKQLVPAGNSKHKPRTVRITPERLDILKRERAWQKERRWKATRQEGQVWHDTGLVFTSLYGEAMPEPMVVRPMTRLCEAAGVPRINAHALRHTAASLAFSRGASVVEVQDMLGHSSAVNDTERLRSSGAARRRADRPGGRASGRRGFRRSAQAPVAVADSIRDCT
jgi:integrase